MSRSLNSISVGIVGASGYTGVELVRLLNGHPELHLTHVLADKAAGKPLGAVWPGLLGLPEAQLPVTAFDPAEPLRGLSGCQAVFLALPHGIAARAAPALLDAGLTVVDLGADFRLRDPAVYAATYGLTHASPDRLPGAVYGLVERRRAALRGARLIANPGCYPTAVGLAAGPLLDAGLCGDLLVADCLSGVSGAGRTPGPRNHFAEVAESAAAYGVGGTHRHVPEIEQELGVPVVFTPHLVPMTRGMLATVHARPRSLPTPEALSELFRSAYAGEAMIVVRDEPPSTLEVRGTNRAHVFATVDACRGVITVISAIDNLVKGASGQAVQALNVALGLPEAHGLPLIPWVP